MFDMLSTWVEPAYGWILVIAYGFYEVHYGRIREHLDDIDQKFSVVIHALRALGKTNSAFDDGAFDERLPDDDSLSADDFLQDREIRADGGGSEDEDA